IGTDRHRLDMWTQEAADAYNEYAADYEYDFDYLRKTDGYLSVSLDGLWLRAPYLHNGSVPYLEDLLEEPENRTKVFYRGYDVYNQEKVGFVAEGLEAEKVGFKYDTSVQANGNQGHLYGTDLSSEDKQALVEYLKTL
ncbi:MAG: cytochrome c, partial [Symploca sp. SIO1A3]|nr:cytochrome c [Symploca sp. SIO1A3]